jgi:RsiW-degrading membrane proteinase PrsW (M82 family)
MSLRELLLMLVSFILGVGCVHLIRRLDRYEREPFGKMVVAAVVGGGTAVLIALVCFDGIARLGFDEFQSALGALLFIGPVEELAKLMGLFTIHAFIRRELNEPADGIIYMACVALGFSLVENYFYAVQPGQAYLIFIRLLVGTPMHIGFSALMGVSFYLWIRNRRLPHLLLIAYLLASLSHGLWDLIVFNHYSTVLLGAAFLLLYGYARNLFLYAISVSPQRTGLAQALDGAEASGSAGALICLHCGDQGPKATFAICGTQTALCDRCDHFNLSSEGLYRLFFHYAGIVKRTAQRNLLESHKGGDWLTLYGGNHLNPKKKTAIFRLPELDAVLERLNHATKRRMRGKWYLPRNLERLERPGNPIDLGRFGRDALAAAGRWLAFPFGAGGKRKRAFRPPQGPTPWNWTAFLVPELWYAGHRLWGGVICVAGSYLLCAYLALAVDLSVMPSLAVAAALLRWVSGRWGCRIYYRRHGRWP